MSSSAAQPLLALLAQNAGGNPTQYMFEQAFGHYDLDWRYLTFEIGPENLGDAVRGLRVLGFRGGHFAYPYKETAPQWLDHLTETATAAGAVNLFFRDETGLVGDNVEGRAVLRAMCHKIDAKGKKAVLLGTGQVARATALELAGAGAAEILVADQNEAAAGELVAMLAGKTTSPVSAVRWEGEYTAPPDTDILINATDIGCDDDERLNLAAESFAAGGKLLVVDLAGFSPRTGLLKEAAERGCATVDGLSVLVERASIGFQLWTGIDPERQVIRDAAEEFLGL